MMEDHVKGEGCGFWGEKLKGVCCSLERSKELNNYYGDEK